MKTMRVAIAVLLLISTSAIALGAAQDGAQTVTPSNVRAGKEKQIKPQDEDQRIFEQHCSRCHTAPEGFSPRISGAIVRHMRVRASLSEHDEQELLRFFNP